MNRKAGCLLTVLMVILLAAMPAAQAESGVTVGTLVTAAAPYDFTAIVPDGFQDIGGSQAFTYGYRSDSMLVAFTPSSETDFAAFSANRMGSAYLSETEVTVNGFDALQYDMAADTGLMAVYAVKTGAAASIMEIAFYPKSMSETAANQAIVDEVLASVRSRTQTYHEDSTAGGDTFLFHHSDTGLTVQLPGSFVKRANPLYNDTIVEYQNDYVSMLIFGYQASLAEYAAKYDMNADEFDITDTLVGGVPVHIFKPKSTAVSTDLAYVVAEGHSGTLLEMIFGANDASEGTENWAYIDQIVQSIKTP